MSYLRAYDHKQQSVPNIPTGRKLKSAIWTGISIRLWFWKVSGIEIRNIWHILKIRLQSSGRDVREFRLSQTTVAIRSIGMPCFSNCPRREVISMSIRLIDFRRLRSGWIFSADFALVLYPGFWSVRRHHGNR